MGLRDFVKPLSLPAGWVAPVVLDFEDIRPGRSPASTLQDDVRGINASLDLIRRTRADAMTDTPAATHGGRRGPRT
jgi:hypothetical protein